MLEKECLVCKEKFLDKTKNKNRTICDDRKCKLQRDKTYRSYVDKNQLARARHFTNIRPMWSTENFSKGGR